MKKIAFMLACVCSMALLSCSESEEAVAGNDNGGNAIAEAQILPLSMDENTRVALNYNHKTSGFSAAWTSSDNIGMFPLDGGTNSSEPVQFTFKKMLEEDNTFAQFSRASFAFVESNTYRSFYPFNAVASRNAIPVDMEKNGGQEQTVKPDMTKAMTCTDDERVAMELAAMAHVNPYDYMVSDVLPSMDESHITMDMKHIPCFVRLYMLAPSTEFHPSRVDIVAEEAVFSTQGTIDLTESDGELLKKTNFVKSLTLKMANITTKYLGGTDRGDYLVGYLAVLPVDLSNTSVLAADKQIVLYLSGTDENGVMTYYKSKSVLSHDNLKSGWLHQWTTMTTPDEPIRLTAIEVEEWKAAVVGNDGKGTGTW